MRSKSSNFFVFQSCELRFSGIFCLDLKRSFPGSFEFWDSQGEYTLAHIALGGKCWCQNGFKQCFYYVIYVCYYIKTVEFYPPNHTNVFEIRWKHSRVISNTLLHRKISSSTLKPIAKILPLQP